MGLISMQVLFTKDVVFKNRTFKKGEIAEVEIKGYNSGYSAFVYEEGEVVASIMLSTDYKDEDNYIISNKPRILKSLSELLGLPNIEKTMAQTNCFTRITSSTSETPKEDFAGETGTSFGTSTKLKDDFDGDTPEPIPLHNYAKPSEEYLDGDKLRQMKQRKLESKKELETVHVLQDRESEDDEDSRSTQNIKVEPRRGMSLHARMEMDREIRKKAREEGVTFDEALAESVSTQQASSVKSTVKKYPTPDRPAGKSEYPRYYILENGGYEEIDQLTLDNLRLARNHFDFIKENGGNSLCELLHYDKKGNLVQSDMGMSDGGIINGTSVIDVCLQFSNNMENISEKIVREIAKTCNIERRMYSREIYKILKSGKVLMDAELPEIIKGVIVDAYSGGATYDRRFWDALKERLIKIS